MSLPIERKPSKRGRGHPPGDNRNIINGILSLFRTGLVAGCAGKIRHWTRPIGVSGGGAPPGVCESVAVALARERTLQRRQHLGSR
jgi:hypothetical protein